MSIATLPISTQASIIRKYIERQRAASIRTLKGEHLRNSIFEADKALAALTTIETHIRESK